MKMEANCQNIYEAISNYAFDSVLNIKVLIADEYAFSTIV